MTELKTTYKEQLEKAKENEINVMALNIAYELDCLFDGYISLTDDEFEEMCKFIKPIVIDNQDLEIWDIIWHLREIIINEELEETPTEALTEVTETKIIKLARKEF